MTMLVNTKASVLTFWTITLMWVVATVYITVIYVVFTVVLGFIRLYLYLKMGRAPTETEEKQIEKQIEELKQKEYSYVNDLAYILTEYGSIICGGLRRSLRLIHKQINKQQKQ